MWIARDLDDNEVWLYNNKPERSTDNTYFIATGDIISTIKLEYYSLKELELMFGITDLTFENSPIELDIKIKNNNSMRITKQEFVKAMNDIHNQYQFEEKMSDSIKEIYDVQYALPNESLIKGMVELLNSLTGESDKESMIDYFIYDLDFGKKSDKLKVIYEKVEYQLSTPELLYDFLELFHKK